MAQQILAIDQSTSATKALLYDIDGQLLNQVVVEHRQLYPRPGWVEHDAEEIWTNTLAALKLVIDGNRSFGTLPELEALAEGDSVVRAARLDGSLWEVRIDRI